MNLQEQPGPELEGRPARSAGPSAASLGWAGSLSLATKCPNAHVGHLLFLSASLVQQPSRASLWRRQGVRGESPRLATMVAGDCASGTDVRTGQDSGTARGRVPGQALRTPRNTPSLPQTQRGCLQCHLGDEGPGTPGLAQRGAWLPAMPSWNRGVLSEMGPN